MTRPSATNRNLYTTLAQINSAGLSYILTEISSKAGTEPQILEHSFATLQMANRAQRLIYQWLWFHPNIKNLVSLKVKDTTLYIKLTGSPEKRGRRGRKL